MARVRVKEGKGRPKAITPEVGNKICELISLGRSLRQVCGYLKNKEGIEITRATILKTAVSTDPEDKHFVDQYANAILIRAHGLSDEILDITDDGSNDWYEAESESGDNLIMKPDTEHINRSRLRVDTRKWMLSKVLPKLYGDKITQEVTGPEGKDLIPVLNITIGK